ncbi:MAG: NeuD/PglB/VioB family sugar acetyltransferase [Betaproteobacteria bacterium]
MSATPLLLIFGCGTFAVQALEIAELAGGVTPIGFINSLEIPAPGTTLEGLPVFHIDALPQPPGEAMVISGLVSNRRRSGLESLAQRGYQFATLVHPSACVSRRAKLRPGCLISSGAQIAAYADLREHVVVNRSASIGHDVCVGAYTTVGPGAVIAGMVEVGDGAYIGVGAVVREKMTIGPGAVVGAGAVVVNAVPAHVLVTGVPARIAKTGVDGA